MCLASGQYCFVLARVTHILTCVGCPLRQDVDKVPEEHRVSYVTALFHVAGLYATHTHAVQTMQCSTA